MSIVWTKLAGRRPMVPTYDIRGKIVLPLRGSCCLKQDAFVGKLSQSQTMKSKDKITRDGAVYYTVAGAAESLGITKTKVKELMGLRQLEWTQFKPDGPLYVRAKSLVAYLGR